MRERYITTRRGTEERLGVPFLGSDRFKAHVYCSPVMTRGKLLLSPCLGFPGPTSQAFCEDEMLIHGNRLVYTESSINMNASTG